MPRISVPGLFDPVFPPSRPVPAEDDPVAAGEICRRLQAMKQALDNLPQQARRLARWKAKRELARQTSSKPSRLSPFRPGFAPGYHRHGPNGVDQILGDCHYFARRLGTAGHLVNTSTRRVQSEARQQFRAGFDAPVQYRRRGNLLFERRPFPCHIL